MRKEPNRNVYVGHRYVPKIMGEWDNKYSYEGLSIVTYQGASYTSKKHVPSGVDILNNEYWVLTGNYDSQIENYRKEVNDMKNEVNENMDNVLSDMNDLSDNLTGELLEIDQVKPDSTIESIHYYVSPNGNDSNNGLSGNSPFKTLQKTISMIPDLIRKDHVITINIMEGDFGNEILEIENILIYGELHVKGTTNERSNHKVYRVRCTSLIGSTYISNLTTTVKIGSGQSFLFSKCSPYVEVTNVKAESNKELEYDRDGVIGLLADRGSTVFVSESDFGGKRYGMRSNYLSRIFSRNNTGEGNRSGVGARWSGILHLHGTQPKGDWKNETTESSGIITKNYGQIIGLPEEDYLTSGEKLQDKSMSVKRYTVNHSAMGLPSGDIPQGKQIRFRFKAVQYGMTIFNFIFGTETSSTSGQYIDFNVYGDIRKTKANNLRTKINDSLNMSEDSIHVEHVGEDGEIDIIIKPLKMLSGRWGINIESRLMRTYEAPRLIDVVIENEK